MDELRFVWSVEFWRMGLYWTLSLLYSYFVLLIKNFEWLSSSSSSAAYVRRSLESMPTNPVCVITGASSGLGAETASALAREGYYVILAGRSLDSLLKTIQEIKKKNEDAQLTAFQVDMSSILSIMKFANSLQKWFMDSTLHPSIQLLVNNAGILATSHRSTVDGYDEMMGTNYIGPFALTNHLLPLLKNSTVPSRIVNVTSFTHRCVFDAGINDEAICVKNSKHFPQSNQYPFAYIYELSKFYLLLFAYELHRRYYLMDPSCKISIMAADPGVVETNIMREVPPRLSRLAFTVLRFLYLLKSPKDGVESIIDAALAPPEASGEYFFGGKGRTIKSSSLSFDVGLAEALWVGSTKMFRETQLKLQVSMDA